MGTLISRWLRYSVIRKGGSSPFWTVVGVLGMLNTLRKRYAGKPQPVSILSDGIRPGEVIEIRHTGKPSKEVRKERASKAALLAQFSAARQPAARGRRAKRLRKLVAGSVVEEMQRGERVSATATPVTSLFGAAAGALPPERSFGRRGRRIAARAARKAAKRAVKQVTTRGAA